MEWAGPTFIKLGQWAASRSDIFPDEMCNIMSKLQSNAPAHSLAETKHIISEAFHGLPFDDIFEEFETTPMGVGAIAQVYKAKLRPGLTVPEAKGPASAFQLLRETVLRNIDIILKSSPKGVPSSYVAVKVVHPGIDRTIRRDLRIMAFFAQVLNAIPSIEWLSLPDEVAQFGEMMHLQLDLRIEATNLARFRYNFKDRTTVSFPHAYPQFTTKKMLIEEFAQGIPLADFLELGGGVYQQDIANEGLDAFLRMLLLDNFVHADLHPGNVMVRFYPAELPKWSKSEGSNQEWPDTETEKILSRLRPFAASKNREGWVRELENIEREGYHAQLIFIDTGLVTELNAVNRRNFLDLFRAIAEFSGYRAGELMCDRCRQPDAVIGKEYFALKMQRLVNNVKSRTLALGSIKIGDILQNVLGMVREHHVRMEGDFVNVVISILLLEGIGRTLDPDLDLLSSALPILRQVSAQSGAEMAKQGDFSVLLMWVGLETRRFLQASVDDTHIYAPMGIDLRNTYRIAGNEPGERPEPAELGLLSLGAPRDGLYLREDIVIRCNITLMSFVRGQMKAASKQVVQRFIKKAELLDTGALQAMFENGRLRTLNPKDLSDVAAQANIARGQTTSYSRPESMAPRSASMSPRPESMSPRPEIMLLRQASMSPHPAPMSLGPTNAIMQMPPPYQMPVEMPGDFTYRTFSGQAEDQAEQRVEFPHGTLNDCSFSARLSQAARLSPALPPMPLALQESKYQPEMVEIRRSPHMENGTLCLGADQR
ncbi:ABC1 family protein [Ceratocystis platani]|uniref:ABC1 family protein n=1 Tax=Ceratocystis fimbriata f. sp. platani TaxID=88771 RepID=A0A0F8DE54_CERFI|nr:ABC1 family protein [Ceratocystis platani]